MGLYPLKMALFPSLLVSTLCVIPCQLPGSPAQFDPAGMAPKAPYKLPPRTATAFIGLATLRERTWRKRLTTPLPLRRQDLPSWFLVDRSFIPGQ